jgi:peroxiredoxin (alkyl hydroperoxide reductase subunit C)
MKKVMLTLVIAVFCMTILNAQNNKIPLIGSSAPSFTAASTNGNLTFPNSFGKSWKILLSHPQDFTPVCSSELLELAYLQNEFNRLGVKLAVISTDDVEQHKLWKAHLEELDYKNRGEQIIDFPIFEDQKGVASRMYGMLHEPVSTTKDVRGVFIIDSENVVRAINFYPMQVGRNMQELVRTVEALQASDENEVLTPANWTKGEDVMMPHYPYTKAELVSNPELENQYYSVGNRMWFKKMGNKNDVTSNE